MEKRAKDMKREFFLNNIQGSLKHVKRYPNGCVLRETDSTKFAPPW